MALVGDVEELDIVWDKLDTCYDQLEKYIAEALEPVMKFMKYKVFKHELLKILHSSQVINDGGKFCSGN
jgi:hypothetical protein